MVLRSNSARGQSEVLGAMLLFGIVVVVAMLIGGMAMASFGATGDRVAHEAIEQSLLEVRSAVTDVALEGESTRHIPLDLPDGATVGTPATSTEFRIIHHGYLGNESNVTSEVIYEQTDTGTLEVEYNDVRYGLEGGGLFKLDSGGGSLIAPPNLALGGYTANIPLLRSDTEGLSPTTDSLEITPGEHIRPVFPNLQSTYNESSIQYDNPVYNGSVEITVTSDYYEGWFEFFDQFTDGNVTMDRPNQTVSAHIESIEKITFGQEIVYTGEFNEQGSANIEGASQTAFLPAAQPIIDQQLEQADDADDLPEECGSENIGDCTISSGAYYFEDGLTVTDDITIDTDDGDVDFLIDGDFDVGGDIVVTGDADHGVEYFVNGSFDVSGNIWIGTDDEEIQAHRNVVYMAGDGMDSGDGTAQLDIILYAPDSTVDLTGNPTINGAIMADTVDVGGNTDITFDADLSNLEGFDMTQTDTPIMYLHITENTAEFSG